MEAVGKVEVDIKALPPWPGRQDARRQGVGDAMDSL